MVIFVEADQLELTLVAEVDVPYDEVDSDVVVVSLLELVRVELTDS